MGLDDFDAVAAFLDRYRDVCAELAIDALPPGELADLAALMLGEPPTTLH